MGNAIFGGPEVSQAKDFPQQNLSQTKSGASGQRVLLSLKNPQKSGKHFRGRQVGDGMGGGRKGRF